MRSPSQVLLPMLACFFGATPARAQVCAGFPSLNDRHFQVGGGAAFNREATSVGTSFTAGKRLLGTLGVGTTSIDALNGSSVDLSLSAGYDAALSHGRTVSLCPTAGVAVGFGPNDINGSNVDIRTVGWSLGVSVGGVATRSSQFALIPSAFISWATTRTTVYNNVAETTPWPSVRGAGGVSTGETYGIAGVGLGLVLLSVLTIQPSVAIPFGLDDSSAAFGIALAINLGRPAR